MGLVVGGVLTEWVSWRAGFYLNLPIGIALIISAYRCIEETPRHTDKFDLLGAITSTLGIGGLVFGFIRSAQSGWADPVTIVSLLGAVILLSLFLVIDRCAAQPILPLHLFASRTRSGAYITRVLRKVGITARHLL